MNVLGDVSNINEDVTELSTTSEKTYEPTSFSCEWIDSQAEHMGIFGVGCSLKSIYEQNENDNDVLIKFIHELLKRLKKSRGSEELASAQVRSLEGKTNRMESEISTKSRALLDSDKEKACLQLRVDEIVMLFRGEKKQMLNEKQELEKSVNRMISRDIQYQATIRKRENDYVKLQKHVQNQVSQKSRASKGKFFDLSTPLGTNSGGVIGSDPVTKKIIAGMSSRQTELLNENSQIRGLLKTFNDQRDLILSRVEEIENKLKDIGLSGEIMDDSVRNELTQIPPDFFELPMTWLNGKVAEEFNSDFKMLTDRTDRVMRELGKNRGSDKNTVEQLKEIVQEQTKLLAEIALQSDMAKNYHERGDSLDFSMILDKEDSLKRERANLEFDREELNKEKEKLAQELVEVELSRFGELLHGNTAGTLHMSSATPCSAVSKGRTPRFTKTPRFSIDGLRGRMPRFSFDGSPIHLAFAATPNNSKTVY